MELYLEEFDVRETLDSVADIGRALMNSRENRFALQLGVALGRMRADRTKVRQVLLNLLSNAAKFTAQGTVTLEAERVPTEAGDWLEFRVRDTGIGMTPEQMSWVFEVFTQAERFTSTQYGGTGLGLALSRQFCQLMGGDIAVESTPGQGSVFLARLPTNLSRPGVQETLPARARK